MNPEPTQKVGVLPRLDPSFPHDLNTAEPVDRIEVGDQTFSIYTDNALSRMSEALKKQYPQYVEGPQKLQDIRNPLKDDHPEAFREGVCNPKTLEAAGFFVTERLKIRHLLYMDTLARIKEAEYILIPSLRPGSVNIKRGADVFETSEHSIYRDAHGTIYKTDNDGEQAQHHPLGKGDEFWLISRQH